MNTTPWNSTPRARAEAERAAAEARSLAEAPAKAAARAEAEAKAAEVGRLEQLAHTVPSSLFDGDAEIRGLRAECAVKAARRETPLGTMSTKLVEMRDALVRVLAGAEQRLDLAAADDALAGDLDFPRLAAEASRIEEAKRKLEACRIAMRATSNSEAFRLRLIQEHRQACSDLDRALMARKRQFVQEHPDPSEWAMLVESQDRGEAETEVRGRTPVDYSAIEGDWRAGVLSPRQLAAKLAETTGQEVSHTAVMKHFEKRGIERNPGAEMPPAQVTPPTAIDFSLIEDAWRRSPMSPSQLASLLSDRAGQPVTAEAVVEHFTKGQIQRQGLEAEEV